VVVTLCKCDNDNDVFIYLFLLFSYQKNIRASGSGALHWRMTLVQVGRKDKKMKDANRTQTRQSAPLTMTRYHSYF
jgi:hypothetical protein